jgi:hypothetical protein
MIITDRKIYILAHLYYLQVITKMGLEEVTTTEIEKKEVESLSQYRNKTPEKNYKPAEEEPAETP